jgi:hypothetical protein
MVRNVKVTSPYGKGRIRQLLAHGAVCIGAQKNHETPKDGCENVTVTFCFGRGGKKQVTVEAVARWEENRYPPAWGRLDGKPNMAHREEGARVDLETGELVIPNRYVAYFEPYHLI